MHIWIHTLSAVIRTPNLLINEGENMKRNLLYLLCVVLVIGLTACDVSEEISDIPCQESSTSEVSKISDNESIASNESDNKAETNQQKSDTLKMSIDFSRISEDGAVIALEVEGLYDAFDKGNHISEYEPWSIEKTAEFDNVNAARSAVFSFFGQTSNCEYKNSKLEMFNDFSGDIYKGKTTDGGSVKVIVHPKTGEIVEFINFGVDTGKNVSLEEAQGIADEIASAYIDTNDYELSVKSDDIHHSFTYSRKIGQYTTAEIIKISISTDGELSYFFQRMVGTFDLTNEEQASVEARLEKLSLPNAKDVLSEKIESIYSGYSEYEVDSATATVLEDGSIAMVYNVAVEYITEVTNENGEIENLHFGSRVYIILK
jgi:hypothetical protein